jgi:hypothetical protein
MYDLYALFSIAQTQCFRGCRSSSARWGCTGGGNFIWRAIGLGYRWQGCKQRCCLNHFTPIHTTLPHPLELDSSVKRLVDRFGSPRKPLFRSRTASTNCSQKTAIRYRVLLRSVPSGKGAKAPACLARSPMKQRFSRSFHELGLELQIIFKKGAVALLTPRGQ